MLRIIIKNRSGFRTYDFVCDKLQKALEARTDPAEILGIEVLYPVGSRPRLVDIGERKIPTIKAVRAHTNMGLKEAKEFVESAPIELPDIGIEGLDAFIRDLREAGATVECE